MESIGAKLQNARRDRGISFEQAQRDTHIARHFLEAIEEERFDDFPGEAYFLGFLRNYAKYLGLDGHELVNIYRNIKIQEQPAPIDELLDRKPIGPRILLTVLILVLVGGIGAVAFLFLNGRISLPQLPQRSVLNGGQPTTTFSLSQPFLERRFALGERVSVPIQDGQVIVELSEIGEAVVITSPLGRTLIGAGQNRVIDLSGDAVGDVRITVRQIGATEDPPSAVVRFDRVVAGVGATQSEPAPPPPQAMAPAAPAAPPSGLGSPADSSRIRPVRVVVSAPQPTSFAIEASFRGPTLFRYEADTRARVERYYQAGERLRFEAGSSLRVWAANAGAVDMRVAERPVVLGQAGEVVAALIAWQPEEAGSHALRLLPMY